MANPFTADVARLVDLIGEQHHPALAGPEDVQAESRAMFARYARNYGRINRGHYDPRDPDPRPDWTSKFLEGVYDVLAEPSPAAQRERLVIVAAHCQAWAADIDRERSRQHIGGDNPNDLPRGRNDCRPDDNEEPSRG